MGFWVNLLLFVSGSVVLYFLKQYFNGGICTLKKDISNKIVIITGASGGIGLEIAKCLAAMGGTIIFACRDAQKTLEIIEEIKKETENEKLEFIPCDLSKLDSVNQFCLLFKRRFSQVDIIINNAGIMKNKYEISENQCEMNYAVNHLGHFALTYQLLDLIRRNPRCRVINVSSSSHSKIDEIDIGRLSDEDYFDPYFSYYRTKLCNLLFTKELQRKLEKVGAKVVAVHPGTVRSNLIDEILDDSKFYKLLFYLIYPIYWLFTKDTFQGAQTVLYCALEKHERLKEGGYYSDCELNTPSELSENKELAKQLWDDSAVALGFI
ncbi:hypothetical protein ABPG74_017507 [Tetrahymena malaccensis]